MNAPAVTDLHLDEPAVAGPGSPNFFNGRLLTGEDLAAEQAAGRAADEQLARLHGPGVGPGLEVTVDDRGAGGVPKLCVGAGAAVTSSGLVLSLGAAVRLELRRTPPTAGTGTTAFAPCAPEIQSDAGQAQLHLLTIGPAAPTARGRARVLGLGNDPAPCAVDQLTPAVRLALRPFAVPLPPGGSTRLRNHVAALLLGDTGDGATALADDPLGPAGGGLLEGLRGSCYGVDEVPLAVLRWPNAADGLEFVDPWAARRRTHQPAAHPPLGVVACERRSVQAEARLAQFQGHLAELTSTRFAGHVVAREHFVSVPAAFVLPARSPGSEDPAGFDPDIFLRGLTVRREAWIEGRRLGAVLAEAASHPTIDLLAEPPEALRVHPIRPLGPGFGPPRHVLVVSGHLRNAAAAQYDLAHLEQAHYADPTT